MPENLTIQTAGLPEPTAAYLSGLIQRHLNERAQVTFDSARSSDLVIHLGMEGSIAAEGFRIEDGEKGEVCILASDRRGLLYGVGKFLHTAVYDGAAGQEFSPGAWRGASLPAKPVRGMYFATHFRNFYHRAPLNEIERYVEDLALWGYNAVTVWFDMHHFRSIEDPEAQEMIARLHAILSAARRIGLQAGLLVLGNEGYNGSPVELRADWTGGHDGYFRDLPMYHVELCPSNPQGFDLLMQWRREVFTAFADIDLDYLWVWPYDQGGCSCARCAPWGGNGFIKIARPVAAMAQQFFPHAKIILSTWYFDCYTLGEFAAFAGQINRDPGWIDFIMAEFPGKFPEYILANGAPGGLPLLGFPEISMFESEPWGGFGANPLPGYIQKMWGEVGDRLAGGFPYSEGIFEDINKVIVAAYYWQGQADPEEVVREYANFACSSRLKDEIARAVLLLENTNRRQRLLDGKPEWMPAQPGGDEQFVIAHPGGADQAYELLQRVDGQLRPAQRDSWRWRILYLRSLIDHELAHNDFRTNERTEAAFEELIQIYYAADSLWAVRPPSSRGRNLSW
jgi:hypothetical protein